MKYKNKCGLCYFGKPMGEWQGTPICEECLSHRIVVTDEMRNRKPGTTPDRIDIPVMKSQGEWEWWQKQTREAVFNALDAANELVNQLVWKEKRLKRALWLARADRAIMTLDYFTLKCRWFKDYMKVEPPKCDVNMVHKWANIERKCRNKSKEYL